MKFNKLRPNRAAMIWARKMIISPIQKRRILIAKRTSMTMKTMKKWVFVH